MSCVPLQGSAILYLYTGVVMRDLAVEQYCIVYPGQNGSTLTQPRREVCSEFHAIIQKEEQNNLKIMPTTVFA